MPQAPLRSQRSALAAHPATSAAIALLVAADIFLVLWALLAGWLAGMVFGTIAAYDVASPTASHWAGSSDIEFGHTIYIGISAVVLNLVITVVLTVVLRAVRAPDGVDETLPHQYTADPDEAPAPAPAGVGAQPAV
jgi:solute:Na+ symporter, SSS family